MKPYIICFLLAGFFTGARAQKKPVEQTSYQWDRIQEGYSLSNDGKYVAYGIPGQSIIASVEGGWEKRLPGVLTGQITFSEDSKTALATASGDSLLLIRLGGPEVKAITGIKSFKTGKGAWVAWLTADSSLVLHNLQNGGENKYIGVKDYKFCEDGGTLVITSGNTELSVVDVSAGKSRSIWTGPGFGQLLVDKDGSHIAFVSKGQLGYWQTGMDKAEMHDVNADDQPLSFGMKGRQVFFAQRAPDEAAPKNTAGGVMVDVWTYKDVVLPPDQAYREHASSYASVINLDGGKVVRLTGDDEHLVMGDHEKGYTLVNREPGNNLERYWNPGSRTSIKLVSTTDGHLIHEFKANAFFNPVELSAGENYVVYFDFQSSNYFSYDIATGKETNISADISTPLVDEENDMTTQPAFNYGLAGWLPGDKKVLIYDRYDIWLVDPTGAERPVDITNGYGRRHHVKFHLIGGWGPKVITTTDLFLMAFNDDTKDNGFYKEKLGSGQDPKEFVKLEACLYSFPGCFVGEPGPPLKAKDADVYLMTRQTASYAPNLCVLTAGGTMKRLTDIQPQKDYDWMTSELINWTTYDGQQSHGILYKPEDFDPNKKYPVIFYYYMSRLSNGLNQFVYPEMTVKLNIPYYTSHGYLVCIPDIHFTRSEPGPSCVNSVVSCADYLSRLPYVDSTKLGLSGHSFGGYETNFLVSATNKFAAASAGAGITDFISEYGTGSLQMMYCEIGQLSIGYPLWEKPALYIENSPIFRVNRVTTPLMIMHNHDDYNVYFQQDAEYFMALRRLGKPVWLLQYDGEGHTLGEANATDFSIRQSQFFNHYLKGAPMPRWMDLGIPPSLKGKDERLELEGADQAVK